MMTPNLKFELSPAESMAESFGSPPGTQYSSLFHSQEGVDPHQAMTPPECDEDSMFGESMHGSIAGTPAPEKKPVKKRKSWGQQLPEPKTNLPPRKRAKTEDEKEQRRVERVLRNRRAAQSSRERKRQEVEALESEKLQIERRAHDLELQLADTATKLAMALKKLEEVTGGNLPPAFLPTAASSPRVSVSLHTSSPIALTKDLFADEQDSIGSMMPQQTTRDTHTTMQSAIGTVDPASLSPPPTESIDESTFNASSFGMTQHPAAMLCDLQCQPKEQRPWMDSTQSLIVTKVLAITLWVQMSLAAISTVLSPLDQIRNSLLTGSALSPTPSMINLIIWLATTSAPLSISNLTTSSTKTKSHSLRPKFTLRIRLLRRLLACSPNMARPLLDATLAAMRLLSEQQPARDCLSGASVCDVRDGGKSSSVESLMTLSWAIKVIMTEQTLTIPEPDAVMGVGQSYGELFVLREFSAARGKNILSSASLAGKGTLGQKSRGARRTALEDEPSS